MRPAAYELRSGRLVRPAGAGIDDLPAGVADANLHALRLRLDGLGDPAVSKPLSNVAVTLSGTCVLSVGARS